MATTPVVAEPQGNGSVNGFSRIIGVVINPKETFADIARRPTWLLPVVLIVAVAIAVTFIYGQRGDGWRGLVEKKIDENPQASQMSPDQKAQAIEKWTKYTPISIAVGQVVGIPLINVVFAGILLGVFSLFASARIDFKIAQGIVSHAMWVPALVSGLLGLIVVSIKPHELIDIEHLVATNVGAFLPQDTAHWLQKLGDSLDLFTFWTIFLMALGFSAASPKKISVSKGLVTVGALWAVLVLVKICWAAAFPG